MKIFAIGDLHLSNSVDKPMHVFGSSWKRHDKRIKNHWEQRITEQDIVLIPGDISWAMTLGEAHEDLQFIHKLPGQKVLLRGNHDYWWRTVSKLNVMYDNMFFLQNSCYQIGEYGICGTRGWICPNDTKFTAHDQKIYEREAKRLELSLKEAMKKNLRSIIVMLHYPPTNDKKEPSLFTQLISKYPVTHVVYGHLHGKQSFPAGLQGRHEEVQYILVSADALDFAPIKIL